MEKVLQLIHKFNRTEFVQTGLRFLGFKKDARSLLGKAIQKNSAHGKLRRVIPLFLIVLFAASAIVPNLSLATNIGGVPTINVVPEGPKVETATKITVHIPVQTIYISRGFSWFHTGIDMVALSGTPVYPIMDGVVTTAQNDWLGYGKHIIIDHGAGFTSLYGHFSKIDAKVGDKVTTATEIGEAGSTGFSTGPHVHLEVRQEDSLIDPAEILPETVEVSK